MSKKSRQKFKYLEIEKAFKSIFHHFWRVIIEANKKFFLEGESPTLIQPSTNSGVVTTVFASK